MFFGAALQGLLQHIPVRRECWPEGEHVVLEDDVIYLLNGNGRSPWEPTQPDILANDWELA